MSNERDGQIVTFYSFKGGTGRTMALANVAWILAANGKRVLVTDWDLESPGLHRFFHPFLDVAAVGSTGGVIDLIHDYESETMRNAERPEGWVEQYARVNRYAFSLGWEFPGVGGLDFLSAGRQNSDYAVSVSGLDWDTFYHRLGGERFLEALRADMKREYDYTLIDSRTGLSDVADICTLHLPDVLVDCFTLSDQGIEGAAQVARAVAGHYPRRNIRILPVPMRVDQAEKEKADAGRALAMRRFAGLPTGMTEADRRRYWAAVEVPYRPFYAYEETLATFGDGPGSPTSLLAAFETLTAELTDGAVRAMPPMDESVREREKARFRRRHELPDDDLMLRYAPEDAVWAEWIERVLSSAGVRVVDWTQPAEPTVQPPARTLTILSSAYVALPPAALPPRDPVAGTTPLAAYVSDLRPLAEFAVASSTHLVNVSATTAAERLLRLVDRPPPSRADGPGDAGLRFPAAEPAVFEAPNRNARFTGREGELAILRRHLIGGGAAAVPVALQGMGGVGKTELALEYVHRFKSAYDVVWWITVGATESADADVEKSLAALAARLGVGGHPNRVDDVNAVLDALGRGEPRRWLLVIDNAEEVDLVERFLPRGGGHVLLTSRNPAWGDRATPIQVDVFARAESVVHLRRRVPSLTDEEADRIADALGDLAVAVAAAGAYLADAGTSVDAYLEQIERHGPSALSVEATWDLSLARLRTQSPAGYRLLQLCSVLASEIDLDLLHSDEMAQALAPFDPSVSERLVRGALVQRINRSALLTMNMPKRRVLVHRLLQAVVREGMTADEVAETRHEVHLVLAASRPRGDADDPQTWDRFRTLWPHIEASGAVRCHDESARELMIDRVRYLWRQGELDLANAFAEEVDAVWSLRLNRLYGTDELATLRRQVLHLRFNRANVLRALARYDEALALDEQVLDEQRALLGDRHPQTLMTAGSLGADLRALGRYTKAIERDWETYDAWREELGEEHPRTLSAANNLAHSYRLVGDFRSARVRDEAVLQLRRAVQGAENPYTLHSAAQLARDLREAGEYDKSVVLLRTVHNQLASLKEIGSEAGDTLNAQVSLAVSLRSAGHPTEAAGLLDAAYPVLEEKFGRDNPETLICRAALVANLLALGETDRAVTEAEQVARIYEQWLGVLHPHTLGALSNLAAAQRAVGRVTEARATAERAATALREVLGPDHPHTLAAEENLGICLAEEGDRQAALERLRAVADRWVATSGPRHPDALRCLANLALVARESDGDRPSATITTQVVELGGVVAAEHPSVRALREGRLVARIVDPHPF
ncbi:FxSxx-COOH system tetratricopeptide repeat protein [Micromonospora sp. CA-249363]|uniref:FxSxx-COOH system tetratricopeptide repeat protein n=1 Tax=Micromonospora sp. CA-249363 TaxID=3239963 RepID=UPI003D8E2B1E